MIAQHVIHLAWTQSKVCLALKLIPASCYCLHFRVNYRTNGNHYSAKSKRLIHKSISTAKTISPYMMHSAQRNKDKPLQQFSQHVCRKLLLHNFDINSSKRCFTDFTFFGKSQSTDKHKTKQKTNTKQKTLNPQSNLVVWFPKIMPV